MGVSGFWASRFLSLVPIRAFRMVSYNLCRQILVSLAWIGCADGLVGSVSRFVVVVDWAGEGVDLFSGLDCLSCLVWWVVVMGSSVHGFGKGGFSFGLSLL